MALLIAAWIHVALFFAFILMLVLDFFSSTIISEEKKPEKKPEERIEIALVLDEPESEEVIALPLPEPAPAEPEPMDEEPEPEPEPPAGGFVQTNPDQATEEQPDDTGFIGENNTKASSDAGAIAGDEKMTALAGEDEVKSDIKTFDSNFSDGEDSAKEASSVQDGGRGDDEIKQDAVEASEKAEENPDTPTPNPGPEKMDAKPESEDLAEIDNALKALEDALAPEPMKPPVPKVTETQPEREEVEEKDTFPVEGGFAPQNRKTRVKGVISAAGSGSLDVRNTALGRYQATIYKRLERKWQIENSRNRSLIAPGNITLYFAVNPDGSVKNQRQVSMNGASQIQWGMILRALSEIEIPKMPKDVVRELDGDALELIVTFNY